MILQHHLHVLFFFIKNKINKVYILITLKNNNTMLISVLYLIFRISNKTYFLTDMNEWEGQKNERMNQRMPPLPGIERIMSEKY